MTNPEYEGTARSVPLPNKGDTTGWTVGFEIALAPDRIYRTVGWLGDHATTEQVCIVGALIYGPMLSFGAVPAPRADEPQHFAAVTERPPALPDGFALDPDAATLIPAEYLAGAQVKRLINAVTPTPVMAAARIVTLIREAGTDPAELLDGAERRPEGLLRRIFTALGEDGKETLMREFPAGEMNLGVRRDELPCICGECTGDREG